MELDRLVRDLSLPGAWPGGVGPVVVRQTHISVVFLVGDRAYKIKKPVDLGFLDYSTLERREHFCREEVRLDRRFSSDVYLGVVPIGLRDGRLVAGAEPAVEWAVAMRRLPDAASLLARVEAGTLDRTTIEAVGRHVAAFHAVAEAGPRVSAFAGSAVVAANARENFAQTTAHIGRTVERAVWERARTLTERAIEDLGARIDARVPRARDTHGDLRLEHVYVEGGALQVIDCIEFADRYRCADPVADIAFLVMDLAVRGERDLAAALADAWFEATGDDDGRAVLPFYVAYRSLVRAKVAGLQAADPATDPARRDLVTARGRRHWLFALDTLEEPGARPALVGIGGLPGTGKSTVGRHLAGFEMVRADVVRKELAGMAPQASARNGYEQGLYTPANKDRVYAECLVRASAIVQRGGRALIDASFSREVWRTQLLATARALGVRPLLLWCEAPPAAVRRRLAERGIDPSDADWNVYVAAAERWEPRGAAVEAASAVVDTGDTVQAAVGSARAALHAVGL